jgi:hypothetical protein
MPLKCSICRQEIPPYHGWRHGCSAWPINLGRCCHDCDQKVVLPERIRRLAAQIAAEKKK